MAYVEIEGPDSGWVASVGFDESGTLRVVAARDGWDDQLGRLVERLLQEPAPGGRIPGQRIVPGDDEVLYDLATALRRRKPVCRGERLIGYVVGGSRYLETGGVDED